MNNSEKIPHGMKETTYSHKLFIQGATKGSRRERSFKLSLPTLVSGLDAQGKPFEEKTRLFSISSQEAIFELKSSVALGTNLELSLEIPKTLILESQLNLFVSGKVVFIQTPSEDSDADFKNSKKQVVALHLNTSYKIQPISI